MEAQIKELHEQLENFLAAADGEKSPVKGFKEKTELAETAIKDLKNLVRRRSFENSAEEILYFKHWAPIFFRYQIIYSLHYNLERERITATNKEELSAYILKVLQHINEWLKDKKELRLYHHQEDSDQDSKLFIHTPPSKVESFLMADDLYCENSISLAKIMAYEQFVPILEKELQMILRPATRKRKWKRSKADLAEIVYTLFYMKSMEVDGHDSDIIDISRLFEDIFDIDLSNIYDIHLHNMRRKKDKAPFLQEGIRRYLDETDTK